MRRIIYTDADGMVIVVQPVRNTFGEVPGITDAEIEQRAWDRLPPTAIDPQFVESNAIPTDRTFRKAWTKAGQTIVVDLAKAKVTTKDRLRKEREPLFQTNDVALLTAIAENDIPAKQAALLEKRRLQDLPAVVDSLTTLDELKAVKAAKV